MSDLAVEANPAPKADPLTQRENLARAFRRLALAVDRSGAWHELGRNLQDNARPADALAAFREALRLAADPLVVAGDVAQAAIASDQVDTEIANRRPTDGAVARPADLLIAGRLHRHLGALDKAASLLEEARGQAPSSKEVATELANIRFAIASNATAEAALRRALAIDPTADELRYNLAQVLMQLGRPAEARRELATCASIEGEKRIVMALLELQLGRQDAARARMDDGFARGEDGADARRMLATILAYSDGVSGAELSAAMRRAGDAWQRPGDGRPLRLPGRRAGRLRLGILGGGLWRHPSTWLTINGIEALDRAEFEIHCFSPNRVSDEFTDRWKALATGWHSTWGKSDEAVAAMVRRCAIDILIDLGGYLNLGRMTVMAHRPARLQVKWVGAQFHTAGVPEIDGFVTDAYEVPPHLAHLYDEALICLPGSYVCYDLPGSMPEVGPLPADANGYVTFGSFNNLMKVTPQTLDVWARILLDVEGSRLWMRTPQFDEEETRSDLLAAFQARGLTPDRLLFFGSADHATVLRDHNAVDLCLQPFPYCGGVTLLEAMAMGVPSVAHCGETFAARHGLSHLSNVDLSDFVAMSTDAYVSTAISKAADLPGLRALRGDLRQRLLDSPICDAARFGREFGHRVRSMWHNKTNGSG